MITEFKYETGELAAVLYPTDNSLTIKDFFVYTKGGVPVASLDAKFDFTNIHPDSQAWVANMLLSRRMHLSGPTDEAQAQSDRQSKRYKVRKAERAALPWYKRIFTKQVWYSDPENDHEPVEETQASE
jgi:hypothetical protein